MFVHVKYGYECGDRIMEWNNNLLITVNYVIEKARHTSGERSTLLLLNAHGRELNLQEIAKILGYI